METTPALQIFWARLPNISQDRKEFIRVKWKKFLLKLKRNFLFCVYIFRAGSNLVSSSIKKIQKKKRVFFYIFSFAYWFSRLFDNLHCVTQVCEVSILFSFSVSKKIVHFFVVSSFWFGQNSIYLIGQNLMFVFLTWKQMSNTRREIFSALFRNDENKKIDTFWVGVVFTSTASSHMPTSHVHIKANLIITWM